MKRIIGLILATLFVAQSCTTYKIPNHIQKEQKEFQARPIEYGETPDIILNPIETIPDTTSRLNSLSVGNWGYNYLETDRYEALISQRAKRPVTAFVFDTGIDEDHPNLKDIIVEGAVFTGEPSWDDGNGHGTHVSGSIAGKKNGAAPVGIASMLRDKGLINLVAVKVLSDAGSGSYSGITKGIQWANERAEYYIGKGHFVVYNFSLGGGSKSTAVDAELKKAEDLGVLVTMAANGNTGRESFNYPGGSEYTEGVAAITSAGKRASFSTIADYSTYALPGQGIYSTYKGGGYAILSGTSMATPHGSGVAAVYASCNPTIDAATLKSHFRKVSEDILPKGWDKETGYGVPKFSNLFETSPTPPEEPDEPDQPDDPTPPEEPTPDPPKEGPKTTSSFLLPKTYTTPWRVMGSTQRYQLHFTITVDYTHTNDPQSAALWLSDFCDNYFARQGLFLPAGSTVDDAAYYNSYFFKLINNKKGIPVEITDATLNFAGVLYKQKKYPSKVSQDKLNRKGGVRYTW